MAPPKIGPITPPIPTMTTETDRNCGRHFGGTAPIIITIVPLNLPAEPTPAIARPTMKVALDWARAEIKVPMLKMNMKTRNVVYDRRSAVSV